MTGYTDQATGGQAHPGTYNSPPLANTATSPASTQPGAAQGGYLGKAQAWTGRVTNNLTGQAEQLKGKFAGSGQKTASGTAGAPNTGYTAGTGMGSTTDTNYSSHTGGAPVGNTGYNTQAGSGYAPADASATHVHGAKGASYTDQAKDWGSRIAGHLSGQAEYLKNKVAGPGTTMGGTGVPQEARHTTGTNPQGSYAQGGTSHSGYGSTQGTQAGYGSAPGTQAGYGSAQGTQTGYGSAQGIQAGSGNAQGAHTGHGSHQAGQSWTDKAKQGLVSTLDYTQQGLEWTKNKVAGPAGTGTTGTGAVGGQHTAGTHHQAGNTTFPPAPGSGNTGYTSAPGSGNTGYTSAPGSGNTGYSGGNTASQYPDVKY